MESRNAAHDPAGRARSHGRTVVSSPRSIFVGAWVAYAVFYFGRVSLSVATPGLIAEDGWTGAEIGALAAGFFWAYSFGGIVSGVITDRIRPRWIVLVGLLGSAAMNGAVLAMPSRSAALVVWTLNGAFQSMGWPAVVAVIARRVGPDQRAAVLARFGTCFVVGAAASLVVGAQVAGRFGAAAPFVLAVVVMIVIGLAWLGLTVTDRTPAVAPSVDHGVGSRRFGSLMVRCLAIAPVTAGVGAVYVALLVWTPTWFVRVIGVDLSWAGALSAVVLVVSVPVVWVVGKVFAGANGVAVWQRAGLLFVAAGVFTVAVGTVSVALGAILLMTIATGLVAASSSVVLGVFPGIISPSGGATATGTVAFIFNLGGAASAPFVGRWVDAGSWRTCFAVLGALVLVGAVLSALAQRWLVPRPSAG